jgi:hypothetical protein
MTINQMSISSIIKIKMNNKRQDLIISIIMIDKFYMI